MIGLLHLVEQTLLLRLELLVRDDAFIAKPGQRADLLDGGFLERGHSTGTLAQILREDLRLVTKVRGHLAKILTHLSGYPLHLLDSAGQLLVELSHLYSLPSAVGRCSPLSS